MIEFWSILHLLLGESVFSLMQGKSGSQHYSFLFATQQLFSSFNGVFSRGPAWTANRVVLRSCPSHFWHSSFHIVSSLPLSTSSPCSHHCSDYIQPFGVPQTCQGQFHFRILSLGSFLCLEWSLTRYTLLSLYLGLHEDKSFLHRLTSNLEIQEHPPNTPSPSSLP